MEHSHFSMTVNSSVLKFALRSKMFEKITCYFSFSNLEFYSELTYKKIVFLRNIQQTSL